MEEVWTEARLALLDAMKGERPVYIRQALNDLPGAFLTKGMVAGKRHRLHHYILTPQKAAEGKQATLDRARDRKRLKRLNSKTPVCIGAFKTRNDGGPLPKKHKPKKANVVSLRKGLLEIGNRECRWPDDESEGMSITFCGRKAIKGSSYCTAHKELSIGLGTTSERTAHMVGTRR